MSTLLEILTHDILPIFIVMGLGFVFARKTNPDLKTASRFTFYILSPALVFTSLTETQVTSGEIAQIGAFGVANTIIMGVLAWLMARLLHLTSRQTAGFLLASMFVNAGNYGLGVNRLAFGAEAEARAVIYFVVNSILVYTVGVLIATGFAGGWRGVIKQLISLPHVYAILVVFAVRTFGWQVPQPIADGIGLPARAAIPMMLLLLGAQSATASVGEYWKPALAGTGLRLIVAPLIAFSLAGVFALNGPARQAGILEASMPAAVINTIVAAEYESEPKLVTGTVVLSTLISPLTLTVLIAMLR